MFPTRRREDLPTAEMVTLVGQLPELIGRLVRFLKRFHELGELGSSFERQRIVQ